MWIINPLVIFPSSHPRAPAHPSTPNVLWAKERTLTPSIVFTFGLEVESFKKCGGVLVLLLKHSFFSFFNMSQSPPKDISYMGLLLHSPSRGSQIIVLALLENASTIVWPNLFQRTRRDVGVIQWSNDVLSILLDLYEEKYLTFGYGSFRIKDWEDIRKKLMTHIPIKSVKTTTQCCAKWDKMKKTYFQGKIIEGVKGFTTSSWVWFTRMNQILEGTTKANGTLNGLDRGYAHVGSSQASNIKKGYQMIIQVQVKLGVFLHNLLHPLFLHLAFLPIHLVQALEVILQLNCLIHVQQIYMVFLAKLWETKDVNWVVTWHLLSRS